MITDAQLIEQHLKLKAHIASATEAHEAAIKPYKDGMATIENALLERLNERGADNTKTEHGTAYKSTILTVKVVERNELLRFCLDNWSGIGSELLQVGATKDAVKQWIESSGKAPPGIETSDFIRVNIRRS